MFDNRLEILRKERKMTQQDVANALGLPTTTYRNYEKDEREPSSEILVNISKLYDVSIDWLLGRSEYRNSIEERALSRAKEFGNKDSFAVEVYRRFLECTNQYKAFYAECFGVNCLDTDEFQPQMCNIIYDHIENVISSYNTMFEYISSCTTEERFKDCMIIINKCLDKISSIRNELIEETYRLYTERSSTSSQYARVAAFGGGTKDVPPPKVTKEKLEKLIEETEQEEMLAEIEASKKKKGK